MILSVTSLAQTTNSSHPNPQLKLLLDQKAPQWLKEYDVPSVAVGYIEDGKLAWTAIYGEQSPGVPATDKTLYNIASLTKPISAEIILRLASEGKVSLDEPISAYWLDPDLKGNPWHKLLTPRLCLSHQTGFANWRRMTNHVLTIQWEPGTRTGYSGEGYEYVAHFAEKKTGRSFEDLAEQYVFKPIGMHDTSYTERSWYAGRVAVPHGPKGETEPKAPIDWRASDLVHTTIADYAKFVISVMNDEGLTKQIAAERLTMTRNLVKPDEEKQACAQQKPGSGKCSATAGMGLGWEVFKHNDEAVIDHDGSDWGAKSQVFFMPQRRMGAVIFTNGENGKKVIQEIVGILCPDPVYVAMP